MTLEVEMPHPDMPGMKQKGRVYVCDLAGTEPAGDIVYALYEKKVSCAILVLPRASFIRTEGIFKQERQPLGSRETRPFDATSLSASANN